MNDLSGTLELLIQAWTAAMGRSLVHGTLVLGLVWLGCRTTRALPPQLQQWLWRAAYLKLLCAFLLVPCWIVPMTIPTPAPAAVTNSPTTPRPAIPPVGSGQSFSRRRILSPLAATRRTPLAGRMQPLAAPPAPPVRWEAVLFGLWAAGVLASLGMLGRERRRLSRLRAACRTATAPELVALCETLCRELRLPYVPEVLETGAVAAPLLVGLRNPALILPLSLAERYSGAELRWILTHELVHVRRRDLLWACLPTLARLLFFFHPLVWLAEREWRLTTEMACDAEVVARHPTGRSGYARLLLELATHPLMKDSPSLQSAGIAESYPTLRRRLTMIRNTAFLPSRRLKVLYAAATVGGAAVLAPWTVRAAPAESPQPLVRSTLAPVRPQSEVPRAARPVPVRVAGAAAPEPRLTRPSVPAPSVPPRPGVRLEGVVMPAVDPVVLDEQWEDVLMLEALQYLRLTPAQLRQLAPLATFAADRQAKQRAEERRVRAELAGIVRENRAALLRGAAGFRQDEAVRLDQRLKQRQVETEAEIGRHVLPRLVRLLSREQVARIMLLTLGRPAREGNRPASAALLDPGSGFVHDLRTVLLQRHSEPALDTADRVEKNLYGDNGGALLFGASPQARREHELIVHGLARALANHGREWTEEELQKEAQENWSRQFFGVAGVDERVQAARQERYELQVHPDRYVHQLATHGNVAELSGLVRLFAERLFLSTRLKPVLEERLRDLHGAPAGR